MKITHIMRALSLTVAIAGTSLATHAAVTTQLGFLVDASGSIGTANFNIMRSGYAAAFAALPTDGTVEVTMLSFASSTVTVVAPTVVTVASLPGIIASVNAMVYTTGGTNTALGINQITAAMTGSSLFNRNLASMINLATDGSPNDQNAAIAAAVAAEAAGMDAMTAEAIGGNNTTAGAIADMVFSPIAGPCNDCGTLLADGTVPPNPMTSNPWVLRVTDFNDFPVALKAKIQASVQVPEPSALALVGIALLGLTLSRRKSA
jgi:uncharacterized protein YegL